MRQEGWKGRRAEAIVAGAAAKEARETEYREWKERQFKGQDPTREQMQYFAMQSLFQLSQQAMDEKVRLLAAQSIIKGEVAGTDYGGVIADEIKRAVEGDQGQGAG